jgi:hypothetical protein
VAGLWAAGAQAQQLPQEEEPDLLPTPSLSEGVGGAGDPGAAEGPRPVFGTRGGLAPEEVFDDGLFGEPGLGGADLEALLGRPLDAQALERILLARPRR